MVLLHDVSEQRGLARQMSYQATHDALTGLVNRREFERRLEEAIESGHRGDGQHVLCYLDLDRFKVVNDTSGHLAGDSMLREVAKLLRDAVRDSDTVGRLGGDEFGMLLVGCPLEKARQIADDVCRAVGDHRFVWRDRIFNIGVSVGLVEISRESGTIEELLTAADSACYVAKKQGSGRVAVYSARDEALARHTGEIQWLQKLQSALKESRFQLLLSAHRARLAAPMAAVRRWKCWCGCRRRTVNQVAPAEFVRAAERYRLMGLVDRWVVQTTLAALGRGAIPVATIAALPSTFPARRWRTRNSSSSWSNAWTAPGWLPAQVCFEISETAVVANLEHARRFVGVLHGMGCQFALDDFGSGVGSFSNLKSLPMDYLKIDGSFIRNLARDSVNQAMVSGDDQAGAHAQLQGDRRAGRGQRGPGCGAPHGRRLRAGLRHREAGAVAAGGLITSCGSNFKRGAIHAVAHAGGLGAIGEDVAEMAAAARAVDLRARHQMSVIFARGHRSGERLQEARPAGAALELRLRLVERLAAAGAAEHARAVLVVERARASPSRCRDGAARGTAPSSVRRATLHRSSRPEIALWSPRPVTSASACLWPKSNRSAAASSSTSARSPAGAAAKPRRESNSAPVLSDPG